MTVPEFSIMHTAYQSMLPTFEPFRTALAVGYALVALADFLCEITGRYSRAGVKPLRMVYLESRPWASAFVWLLLHAFFVRIMVSGGRWWQPAIFMLCFGLFLGERILRAVRFTEERKA